MIVGYIKEKKGSALLYAMIVVFIVLLMGGILVNFLTYEIKVNKRTEERIRAKYLAEAGIEHGMLETGPTGPSPTEVFDTDGEKLYEYAVSISGGEICIVSGGFLDNTERYRIQCWIKDDAVTEWLETPLN